MAERRREPGRLTDVVIKQRKEPGKMGDGGGLYIQVTSSGGKLWRHDYRFGVKRNRLSYGAYPDVSIVAARAAWRKTQEILAAGKDPAAEREAEKRKERQALGDTFKVVADEVFKTRGADWRDSTEKTNKMRMEHLKPLWDMPVRDVTLEDVLSICQPIANRDNRETARRVFQLAKRVLKMAKITGKIDASPLADIDPKDVLPPVRVTHQKAITEAKEFAETWRRILAYKERRLSVALQVLAHTAQRSHMVRFMRWSQIDRTMKRPGFSGGSYL